MHTKTFLLPLLLAFASLCGCVRGGNSQQVPTGTEPQTAPQPQRLAQAPPQPAPTPAPLDQIRLPEGFRISYYASDVPGARSLCLGARGRYSLGLGIRGTCTHS